jgi:broad specificity phosphatase PhoE
MESSSSTLTFIFVRHGEAEHNVAFHKEGNSVFKDEKYRDAPLTAKGIEQARKTAENLLEKFGLDSYAALWTSPLTRTIQTSLEIFEEINVDEMILHDNLMEWQGADNKMNERSWKHQIKAKYAFLNYDYMSDGPANYIGKENKYALRQRMFMLISLLQDLYAGNDKKYVILVSHHDAIHALTGKSLANAEYCVTTLAECCS